jgi:hypothetical protein
MNVRQEYLQLVQLTKNLLLKNLPKNPLPKDKSIPVAIAISQKPSAGDRKLSEKVDKADIAALQTIVQPKPVFKLPAPAVTTIPSAPKAESRPLDDMLALLKTHCPTIKLIKAQLSLDILLLTAGDLAEMALLQNLKKALNKQNIYADIIHPDAAASLLDKPKIVIASKELIIKSTALHSLAKRDINNRPLLGSARLVLLPDPSKPAARIEFWNTLLELWKTL